MAMGVMTCAVGSMRATVKMGVAAADVVWRFQVVGDRDVGPQADERQHELAQIDGGKTCWCTHVCFIHDSMRHSRRSLLYEIPRNYLTRESW